MPCNCGNSRPKEAMTSEMATARGYGRSSNPKYKVTPPGGEPVVHDLYLDAKRHARETGGELTEVREAV